MELDCGGDWVGKDRERAQQVKARLPTKRSRNGEGILHRIFLWSQLI